jgi:hypothetical protein
METFHYQKDASPESNFQIWYMMNSEERTVWKEKPYTIEEGIKVFEKLFGVEVKS